MSVAELKERHAAATETVSALRERLRQKRLSLLDTDGVEFLGFCVFDAFMFCVFWSWALLRSVWLCGGEYCSGGVREVAGPDTGELRTHGSGLL
jgi:hypothetical protein